MPFPRLRPELRALFGRARSRVGARFAGTAAACVLLTISLPATAQNGEPTFLIRGRGWGHGIGMSQWGARGFADSGRDYRRVLSHYYPGTTLARVPDGEVRVLLARGASSAWIRSSRAFSAVDGAGRTLELPAGAYRVGRGLALTVGGRRFFPRSPLRVEPGLAPLALGGTAYRGSLVVHDAGGAITVVNAVALDAYLRGVVPREMPAVWAAEALKAQAVAARSYAVAAIRTGSLFDLYADTRSQVYGGLAAEAAASNRAVAETAGEVLTWRSRAIPAFYHSTSGGRTAAIEDVWPAARPAPYLVSVADPGDARSPHHEWALAVSAAELGRRLGTGAPRAVATAHNDSDRATHVELRGGWGTRRVPATAVARAFGLRSTWFDITTRADAPANVDPAAAAIAVAAPVRTNRPKATRPAVVAARPASPVKRPQPVLLWALAAAGAIFLILARSTRRAASRRTGSASRTRRRTRIGRRRYPGKPQRDLRQRPDVAAAGASYGGDVKPKVIAALGMFATLVVGVALIAVDDEAGESASAEARQFRAVPQLPKQIGRTQNARSRGALPTLGWPRAVNHPPPRTEMPPVPAAPEPTPPLPPAAVAYAPEAQSPAPSPPATAPPRDPPTVTDRIRVDPPPAPATPRPDPPPTPLAIADVRVESISAMGARVRWRTTLPARTQAGRASGGSPAIWTAASEVSAEHETVLSGLEPGRAYRVWLTAVDDWERVASTSVDLTTPPLGVGVAAAAAGDTIVLDGEPFFPRVLWAQCSDRYVADVAAGINVFMGDGCDRDGGLFDQLDGRAVGIIDAGRPDLEGPGVIGWHYRDEWDNYLPGTISTQELATLAPKPPQGRLSFLTLTSHFYSYAAPLPQGRALYDPLLALPDVVGFDLYPMQVWCQPEDFEHVFEAQRELEHASSGKPTFQWIEVRTMECPAAHLTPTPATVRAETWLAIAGGADGIGYFPNRWAPDVGSEITRLNREIAELAPALLADSVDAAATTPAVRVGARTLGGATYVIAVNSSRIPVETTINVAGIADGQLDVFGEERNVDARAGVIADAFAPLEAHIYIAPPAGWPSDAGDSGAFAPDAAGDHDRVNPQQPPNPGEKNPQDGEQEDWERVAHEEAEENRPPQTPRNPPPPDR